MARLTAEMAWERLSAHNRAYYEMFSAVYSGNPRDLRATARIRSFWRRASKQKIHVPIAADIAATSSDLLFGEEPQIMAVDEREIPIDRVQSRLEAISRHSNLHALICEAAESCSALGDVYLKILWDREREIFPQLRVIQGDSAYPEYQMGSLVAIHIFTVLDTGGGQGIVRTHETYSPGLVETEMYLGSEESLGTRLGNEELQKVGLSPVSPVPGNLMLAAHIPNIRPNRMFRGSYMGRSDFDNLRDLMDALDETYSSWIRDIRLGKARLLVPAEYLRRTGEDLFGNGRAVPTFEFDEDVETLVALDVDTDRGGNTITPSQFAIRADDHMKTCQDLIQKIVSGAGYAPQTFGINIEGMAQSGTALRIREKKSYSTTGKKQAYWQDSLETLLTALLHLDANLYPDAGSSLDAHVHVRFPTVFTNDLPTMASSLSMLNTARAMSTEVKVEMLHPDWTRGQISSEVERIYREFAMTQEEAPSV